jgi:hypothetical protein
VKIAWVSEASRDHPDGYWVATTDDAGYDGAGPDPLTAVSNLVAQIEREFAALRRKP